MSAEHMIPTLPDAAPMDRFVQSNRIPSLAAQAYEATGTYAVEMGLTGSEINLSPGDVLYRQPPTTTDADRDTDSPSDEWDSGETWWFIVGVEPDRFLIFDLERGIYRSWPDDRVVADLREGYTYDVFSDNR